MQVQHKVKNFNTIFPLIHEKQCRICKNWFVRERMWVINDNYGYVCKCCAETEEELEFWKGFSKPVQPPPKPIK